MEKGDPLFFKLDAIGGDFKKDDEELREYDRCEKRCANCQQNDANKTTVHGGIIILG